jgi:DNA-binding MarR family transcriptional regulator
MTRQEAREITGLSIGRIQQLISGRYKFGAVQLLILQIIGEHGATLRAISRDAQRRNLTLGANLSRRVRELEEQGLVERKGDAFMLTSEGRDALAGSRNAG